MHEDVKLDLARLFFKTTIAVFMIATIAVLLFWVCAVLIVMGYFGVESYDQLLEAIRMRICIVPS